MDWNESHLEPAIVLIAAAGALAAKLFEPGMVAVVEVQSATTADARGVDIVRHRVPAPPVREARSMESARSAEAKDYA